MTTIFKYQTKIRYSETGFHNQLSIVNLVNCLQDVAAEHTFLLKTSATDLYQQNLAWVIYNYHIRIHRLPVWRETVHVTTFRYPYRNLYELRAYDITGEDETPLVDAQSAWVLISLKNRKPVRLKNNLPESSFEFQQEIPHTSEILPELTRTDMTLPFKIRMHDLDFNRHVNNAIFIEWAVETVPEEIIHTFRPNVIKVNFLNEAVYGDKIISQTQKSLDTDTPVFMHRILREKDQKELTRLETHWARNDEV